MAADETHDSNYPRGRGQVAPQAPVPKTFGLLLVGVTKRPGAPSWKLPPGPRSPILVPLWPVVARPLGAVTTQKEALSWGLRGSREVYEGRGLCLSPKPLLGFSALCMDSSSVGLAPREEGTQGKGCGCKEESPVGLTYCSWGYLQALLLYGFWGCGGGQDLPVRLPILSTAVDPLLLCGFLRGGRQEGPSGSPLPPR